MAIKDQKNIALLGAGHIGSAIARRLAGSGDYRVTVIDREDSALQRIDSANISTRVANSADPAALALLLREADIVINALPYHLASAVATVARDTHTHYFDLTEDVSATRQIQAIAHDADTLFMPQCGLAPGFIGIAAHALTASFDQVLDVKMRVGALPEFPNNELKYNLTWSIDGLINEYCHPCEALHDGHPVAVDPLEGLEHFSLDGVEYEAFNTSGGLGTLCETLNGRIRNLDYKSVRYPGHQEKMKFLLDDLGLKREPELLKKILRKSIPGTMQDVVLVFITVSGLREGQLMQEVFSRKIFSTHTNGHHESAIQRTTAAGVCAAVDLFVAGRLPPSGFVAQEQVQLDDFLANRFGNVYRQTRGV